VTEPSSEPARHELSPLAFWLGHVPSQALGAVACFMLFGMMVLTFVDVAGRYLFSSPLPAAYEIISLIMPAIIFCALPYVGYRENHVTIDLLDTFLTPRVRRVQGVLVNLVSAAALGFISYRLFMRSYDHRRFDEVTDELFLNLWPFSLTMAVLAAIATLAFIANAYDYLTKRHPGLPDSGVSRT
jgi:TRAP-type C4-dicarboxylate transport system permease small subunit